MNLIAADDTLYFDATQLVVGIPLKIQAVTAPVVTAFPMVDVQATLPRHAKPYNPAAWWVRTAAQITGITIHHTGCNTPQQAAQIHVNQGKPTIEYHYFVGFDGTIYHCLNPLIGCWHDHTGHYNRNVAIALAGYWHQAVPGETQLSALAWITAQVAHEFGLSASNVDGHQERAKAAAGVSTVCPGWNVAGWRARFFTLLEGYL